LLGDEIQKVRGRNFKKCRCLGAKAQQTEPQVLGVTDNRAKPGGRCLGWGGGGGGGPEKKRVAPSREEPDPIAPLGPPGRDTLSREVEKEKKKTVRSGQI